MIDNAKSNLVTRPNTGRMFLYWRVDQRRMSSVMRWVTTSWEGGDYSNEVHVRRQQPCLRTEIDGEIS